jgi:hypothetical protein
VRYVIRTPASPGHQAESPTDRFPEQKKNSFIFLKRKKNLKKKIPRGAASGDLQAGGGPHSRVFNPTFSEKTRVQTRA